MANKKIKQIRISDSTYDIEPAQSEVLSSSHITDALGFTPASLDAVNNAENSAKGYAAELVAAEAANRASNDAALGSRIEVFETRKPYYEDAVNKAHEHTNKSELDLIQSGDKAKWDAKQDALNAAQLAAVNSGIDSEKAGALTTAMYNNGIYWTKEAASGATLTWDGQPGGRESFWDQFYKITSDTFDIEHLSDLRWRVNYQTLVGIFAPEGGTPVTTTYTITNENTHFLDNWYELDGVFCMYLYEASVSHEYSMLVFTKDTMVDDIPVTKGIYFGRTDDSFISSLHIPSGTVEYQISSQHIDDTIDGDKRFVSNEHLTALPKLVSAVTNQGIGYTISEAQEVFIDWNGSLSGKSYEYSFDWIYCQLDSSTYSITDLTTAKAWLVNGSIGVKLQDTENIIWTTITENDITYNSISDKILIQTSTISDVAAIEIRLSGNTKGVWFWGTAQSSETQLDSYVAGLQANGTLPVTHKISSDMVEDTGYTNKFVSERAKTAIETAINMDGIAYDKNFQSNINLTWDGSTSGKEVFWDEYYKITNETFGIASIPDMRWGFQGGYLSWTIIPNEGSPITDSLEISTANVSFGGNYGVGYYAHVISDDYLIELFIVPKSVELDGNVITAGTYFCKHINDNNTTSYITGLEVYSGYKQHKINAWFVDDNLNEEKKFVTPAEKSTWTGKQDKLTAGTNITIDENNVISASGGGISYVQAYNGTTSITNGTINASGEQPSTSKSVLVEEGQTLVYTVTANSGYNIESASGTGCTVTLTGTGTSSGTATISTFTEDNWTVIITCSQAPQTYTISNTLTNVTASGSNPSTILSGGTATLTYSADSGYELPDSITVTGASYTWTKATGTVVLSSPTGNVSITISGVVPQAYTISNSLTNITAGGSNPTTILPGGTATLRYTPNSGYLLPTTVTVTGANYTWTRNTGTIVLSNPTGNVTITISGVASSTQYPVIWTFNYASSTNAPAAIDMDEEVEEYCRIVPDTGYVLKNSSFNVSGCGWTWDSDENDLILYSPTGPVTITVTATVAASYSVTWNLTNCTASTQPTTMLEGQNIFSTITPSSGYYITSSEISVSGCSWTWGEEEQNELHLYNPTGNVSVTINAAVASGYTVNVTTNWLAEEGMSGYGWYSLDNGTTWVDFADKSAEGFVIQNVSQIKFKAYWDDAGYYGHILWDGGNSFAPTGAGTAESTNYVLSSNISALTATYEEPEEPEPTEYDIEWELNNCTISPETYSIIEDDDLYFTVTPESGFSLPSSISVSGCEFSWNPETEEEQLNIWSPTDTVIITIECEE